MYLSTTVRSEWVVDFDMILLLRKKEKFKDSGRKQKEEAGQSKTICKW